MCFFETLTTEKSATVHIFLIFTSGHPIVTGADDPLLAIDYHRPDLSRGILGPHRGEAGRGHEILVPAEIVLASLGHLTLEVA